MDQREASNGEAEVRVRTSGLPSQTLSSWVLVSLAVKWDSRAVLIVLRGGSDQLGWGREPRVWAFWVTLPSPSHSGQCCI